MLPQCCNSIATLKLGRWIAVQQRRRKGKKAPKLCPHGMNKSFCIPCGGNGICVHQRRKYTCKECKDSSHCEHNVQKYGCRKYGGGRFCDHGKQKGFCKDCDGRALCKTPHCTTIKNLKYDGGCCFCFVHLFPDTPVARNYKTKENTVATFLKEKFPDVTWKCDKRVENGCSRRRSGLLLEHGKSHRDY